MNNKEIDVKKLIEEVNAGVENAVYEILAEYGIFDSGKVNEQECCNSECNCNCMCNDEDSLSVLDVGDVDDFQSDLEYLSDNVSEMKNICLENLNETTEKLIESVETILVSPTSDLDINLDNLESISHDLREIVLDLLELSKEADLHVKNVCKSAGVTLE